MPMMGRPRRPPGLLNQIVAQNRPLQPQRPQGQLVGTPQALPGLIPYGPQPQGLQQNTRFTGAGAPGGALSLTHPEAPPTFHEPQFQSPQMPQQTRLAPMLAALAMSGLAAAPSGATAAPPGGPVPQINLAPGGGIGPQTFTPGGPIGPQTFTPGAAQEPRQVSGITPRTGFAPQSSALIAALAQMGQRLGSSRSGSSFF